MTVTDAQVAAALALLGEDFRAAVVAVADVVRCALVVDTPAGYTEVDLWAAFVAGFEASGEGWNGDLRIHRHMAPPYPAQAADEPDLRAAFEAYTDRA